MPLDTDNLTTVLGPVTGSGPTTLTVTASRSMSLTIGCIGKGRLTVKGALSAAAGAVLCSDASRSRDAFARYYCAHVSARPGEQIKLRVLTGTKTTWDIRVDGDPAR